VKYPTHDVAVLGSGIGGPALAAILGRQGFRVLLPLPPIQRMFDFDPSVLGGPAPQMPVPVAVLAMT
jgi:hypothetical protein